jgi:lipopolysaccharide biosynthesis protein/glycosyltransferase involved in cell wall biosynthesis
MIENESARELSSVHTQDKKTLKRSDTCVILHLYYPEMWEEIQSYLSNLGEKFDLFITIPYDVDISVNILKAQFPQAQIYRCENRGRDIAPFLIVFSAIRELGYKYVCKIHTKKSQYITNGDQWREEAMEKLLGSPEIIAQIKEAFEKHLDWGIIGPQGHVVPHDYFWRPNAENVIRLANSIGIPTETIEFSYVAGSMFWFRPDALSPLIRLGLRTQDFEPEQGQIDGTLAHAIERFFGMVAAHGGYKIAESNSKGVKLPDISFQFRLLIEAFQQRERTYGTQLSGLNEHISSLKGQVSSLHGQVSNLEEQTSNLKGQVSNLNGQISNLNGQISNLNGQISKLAWQLSNKKKELSEIYQSKAWRLILILRRIRLWLLPVGSTRERFVRWAIQRVRIIRDGSSRLSFKELTDQFKESTRSPNAGNTSSEVRTAHQAQQNVYIPISEEDVDPSTVVAKVIAFYLPQFHPIPENDEWWGKGFTEWTNVTKALPNFKGHYQPHVPDEMGYYDLRLPEVQKRQVELAKKYGIHGFCFYYYWFSGKRLLERPLNQYLANPDFDLPFCLCWANENWTRRWDGAEHQILIAQDYNEHEYEHFIHDISSHFLDPRYIRVEGKPVLLVYRINLLPDPQKAVEVWRTECRKMGIGEIYLIAVQSFGISDPRPFGFDAAVEFPPSNLGQARISNTSVKITNPNFKGQIFDYNIAARLMMEKQHEDYTAFKSVMPSWDNTARRQNESHIFINSSPDNYKNWLSQVVNYTTQNLPEDRRFIFVNAWNEWAEGTHLEPDSLQGYAYLQATAEAITRGKFSSTSISNWTILFVSHDAHKGGSQTVLLNTMAWFKRHTNISIKILCLEGGDLLPQFQELADTIVLRDLQQRKMSRPNDDFANRLLDALDYVLPDLIYGNTVVAGKAYPWLNKLGVPILTHVHELDSSIKYYSADSIEHVLNYSSHFLACSKAVQENLIRNHGVSADKISIGHASIDKDPGLKMLDATEKDRQKKGLGLVQNKHLIFGCGIGMPFRKGADLFIELGRILRRRGYDCFHLYWIGEFEKNVSDDQYGSWSSYLERLEQSEVREYVTFMGYKKNPREYLQVGDIHVMTAREEPFGLVALEAADCEVPTICFDNAGAADFVGEDAGFIVPFGDLEAMAQKIIDLMENEEYIEILGRQAKQKFLDAFTVDRTTPHILSACRKVAGKKPGVSIIVPNYNHAQYLPQRLESIFNQTYQDFEVILLDDFSSDNSLDILKKYVHAGDIQIIRNDQNSGSPFRQWLRGIDLAKADIWWIAESDDISDPSFLETLLPAFDHPRVKLAYVNSHVIDETDRVVGDYLRSDYLTALSTTRWSTSYRIPAEQEINDALGVKDTILNVSAVLFRKYKMDPSVRKTLNEMRSSGDWYFVVQAIKGGEVYYDARKLNYHRRHSESVIGKLIKSNKVENFYKEMSIVHQAIAENYDLSTSFYQKWEQYLQDQWKQFFNDRPFDDLRLYYPVDDHRSIMKRRITDKSL